MWSASDLTKTERNRARAITRGMIRRGELTIPSRCQRCNKKKPLETHHLDYTKPELVLFVCHWCHIDENRIQRDAVRHARNSNGSGRDSLGHKW